MKKKQTAIDSLIKRCNDSLDKEPINPTQQKIVYSKALCHIIILLEEAKEMEEKQIKDAFVECWKSNIPEGIECKLSAKEYYYKTYGNANDKRN